MRKTFSPKYITPKHTLHSDYSTNDIMSKLQSHYNQMSITFLFYTEKQGTRGMYKDGGGYQG